MNIDQKLLIAAMLISITCAHNVIASPKQGWQSELLSSLTNNCVKGFEDRANDAARKNYGMTLQQMKVSGAPISRSDIDAQLGHMRSICSCLTDRVASRWTPEELVQPSKEGELRAYVEGLVRSKSCR